MTHGGQQDGISGRALGYGCLFSAGLYVLLVVALYLLFRYGHLAIQWFAFLIARLPS